MNERQQDQVMHHDANVVPWEQGHGSDDAHPERHFQARVKRRYVLLLALSMFGFASMGFWIGDEGKSEIFVAFFPLVIVPLCIRFTGFTLAILIGILIPFLVYLTSPDLVVLLGTITVVLIFGIAFTGAGLLLLFILFDRRPQLIIGPDGICCRQFSADVIPWNDITYIDVSAHGRSWGLKDKNLVIGLRDSSCYPKPSGFWTPQFLIYTLFNVNKKPNDPAWVHVSGTALDPPLPVVMKVIDHYRHQKDTKPQSTRTSKTGS